MNEKPKQYKSVTELAVAELSPKVLVEILENYRDSERELELELAEARAEIERLKAQLPQVFIEKLDIDIEKLREEGKFNTPAQNKIRTVQ